MNSNDNGEVEPKTKTLWDLGTGRPTVARAEAATTAATAEATEAVSRGKGGLLNKSGPL